MRELLPAVVGWLMFVVFVGFIAIKVGSLSLIIVVGGTVILATIDVLQGVRDAFVNDARRRDAAAPGR
jgi:hypothetical protein